MELHLELALVKLKDSITEFKQSLDGVINEIDGVVSKLPHNNVVQHIADREKELRPVGAGYSVIRWSREGTGIYTSKSANGLRLSVFRSNRGEWFAQVGDTVLNDKPLPQKSDAVAMVENVLIQA